MKNWKDIQDEIKSLEEPLSDSAWKEMSTLLDGRKKGFKRGIWLSLFVLVLIGISVALLLFEKNQTYYQPRSQAESKVLENEPHFKAPPATPAMSQVKEAQGQVTKAENYRKESKLLSDDSANNTQEQVLPSGKNKLHTPGESPLKPNDEKPLDFKDLNISKKPISFLDTVLLLPQHQVLPVESLKPEVPKKANHGLELRFYIAPTYNLSSLGYNNPEEQTHQSFDEAKRGALKAGSGLDAGFELRYRLAKNLMISSGISFREIVTQNNYDFEVNAVPVIDSASGNILTYIQVNEPQKVQHTTSNIYNFINVPVSLYFEKPLRGRWSVTAEAIHHTSILLSQSSYKLNPTTLQIGSTENNELRNSINGCQFRLGLRYRVNPNFYLALEPSYRSYYQDFFTNPNISWRPKDFSISLSGIVQLF